LEYARCAFEKGDLDLAASTLEPGCLLHRALSLEIAAAQRRCEIAERRLRVFRTTVLSLVTAVILILTGASIWISAARKQAVAAKEAALVAKEAAVDAQHAEAEQRKLAEAAKAKSQEEEARAVQALADLEKAFKDLVEAQKQEKRALEKAEVSDRVATETRDELAKSGMLLDNSWWVFDAGAAKQKQAEAAQAIGMPVELTIALSEDARLELLLIPPGDFVMGSPPKEEQRAADEHLHRVRHTAAFYLAKFELTETQWQALAGRLPKSAVGRAADASLPVVGVSYEQFERELLPALRSHAPSGYEFRLPSEAEWEYACRAGTGTAYYTGNGADALEAAGWFVSNSDRKLQPVGGKTPNAFGLYDMHGNVGEICTDYYLAGFYLESPVDDPVAPREGEFPILRGGSTLNMPEHCRSAYRSYVFTQNQYDFLGLRLALVAIRADGVDAEKDLAAEDNPMP
jgi:formylglycine-generating enzyme required for sulfatase activity